MIALRTHKEQQSTIQKQNPKHTNHHSPPVRKALTNDRQQVLAMMQRHWNITLWGVKQHIYFRKWSSCTSNEQTQTHGTEQCHSRFRLTELKYCLHKHLSRHMQSGILHNNNKKTNTKQFLQQPSDAQTARVTQNVIDRTQLEQAEL